MARQAKSEIIINNPKANLVAGFFVSCLSLLIAGLAFYIFCIFEPKCNGNIDIISVCICSFFSWLGLSTGIYLIYNANVPNIILDEEQVHLHRYSFYTSITTWFSIRSWFSMRSWGVNKTGYYSMNYSDILGWYVTSDEEVRLELAVGGFISLYTFWDSEQDLNVFIEIFTRKGVKRLK